MKWQINVIASRRVIVEADSKDEAQGLAANELSAFDWEIDEWRVEKELPTDADVSNSIRHGAVMMEDW